MTEYAFTLRFRLADAGADPGELEAPLLKAGCDDATLGIGLRGRIALDFVRESRSAREALASAVRAVRKASPGAVLVEASPDLVGLSDVAAIIGCSRQNMRKLMQNHPATFPSPVHEGNPSLWHLSSLLDWLRDEQGQKIDASLVELAKETRCLNLARDLARLGKAGVPRPWDKLVA